MADQEQALHLKMVQALRLIKMDINVQHGSQDVPATKQSLVVQHVMLSVQQLSKNKNNPKQKDASLS